MPKAIPKGYRAVTPGLVFKDSRKALVFYKKAFRSKELMVFAGADGQSVIHAEIKIGNSIIMLCDEQPGQHCQSAETLGASGMNIHLYVKDAEKTFKKAVKAGATVITPLTDMFWGDRMGTVKDPFGYCWSIATHTKDLSEEEMKQAGDAFLASLPQPQ